MAERGARLLLSLLCLTFLYPATTVSRHAEKGTAARPFSPFWFSVEPWDTLAVRGAPALLNCSAHSGDPASEPTAPQARVEWKKDGTFLSLAPDDGRRRVLPDGSLLISSVVHSKHNKPDEGTYQCVATIDSLGTIASRTARLTVAGRTHTQNIYHTGFYFILWVSRSAAPHHRTTGEPRKET
ncbi:neogenin-like [Oncorhynchus nerka]|uniref:neogenin-like n=1 Tax=Oncorhynchus nerka TaxID=8023 RepID=UPI0031B87EF2